MHFLIRQYTTLRRGDTTWRHLTSSKPYIKTKLLELLGEFPRTHSLVTLLRELSRVFKEEEVEKFVKENIGMLTKLSDVYITSRYYTREFYEDEVKELMEFAYRVRSLLEYD